MPSGKKYRTTRGSWFQQHFNTIFDNILLEKLDVHVLSRYTLDTIKAGWMGLESAGEWS